LSKENDRSLRFYHEVLGLEHLHYGLWEPDEALTLENLKIAQQRYEAFFVGRLPAGATSVLDVGCGTSALCRRLRDAGYAAESLSPDRTQGERFRAELNLPFHACRFEHFEPGHRYDAILMSESCQYVPLDRITDQVKRCLKPGGHWLICDYFVQDHAKGRIAKSGHRVSEFKSRARAAGFETVEEVDVTEAASRTLEIANDAIERMILGGEILTEKFRLTRPRLTWLIARLTRKKWKKLQEERVLIDPEAFRNNKRYLFIKYRLPA